jgi:DNA topoisomerase-1
MEVLENNFEEFTSLDFTRNMDDQLDEIANGKAPAKAYLERFFLGDAGLRTTVEARKRTIPYPSFEVGKHPETDEEIIVRLGTSGNAFLQLGPREQKKFANVPEDIAPGDLTVEKALELFAGGAPEAESIGNDPTTGRRLLLRHRQGYYLEVERTDAEIEAKEKPRWVSLPPGVDPKTLSQEDLDALCQLPRSIGKNPETGVEIVYKMGKYGAYIECGSERRTLEDWRRGLTATTESAMAILAQPKFQRGARAASAAIQEFGELEGAAGPVRVLSGRFGPYVTDGETNATLPKGSDPASLTAEAAVALLVRKREAGPSPKAKRFVRRGKPASGTKKKK